MPIAPPPAVAGLSLASAEPYVIRAEDNAALCATLGAAPAADGSAHPVYYYVAAQAGMGLTVAELCRACGFDAGEGLVLASSKVAFARPLRVGEPYRVDGRVLGLERRPSRRFGRLDLLEYEIRLRAPDGAAVLTTVNVWALPRGAAP